MAVRGIAVWLAFVPESDHKYQAKDLFESSGGPIPTAWVTFVSSEPICRIGVGSPRRLLCAHEDWSSRTSQSDSPNKVHVHPVDISISACVTGVEEIFAVCSDTSTRTGVVSIFPSSASSMITHSEEPLRDRPARRA